MPTFKLILVKSNQN